MRRRPDPLRRVLANFSRVGENAQRRRRKVCAPHGGGAQGEKGRFEIGGCAAGAIAAVCPCANEPLRIPAHRARRTRRLPALCGAYARSDVYTGAGPGRRGARQNWPRSNQARAGAQLLGGRLHQVFDLYFRRAGIFREIVRGARAEGRDPPVSIVKRIGAARCVHRGGEKFPVVIRRSSLVVGCWSLVIGHWLLTHEGWH
jgi:hypothetical protein